MKVKNQFKMNDLKQLFVPYEIAKQLKEMGFDWPCLAIFKYKDFITVQDYNLNPCTNTDLDSEFHIAAPLFQQVVDWLREEKKITIIINHIDNTKRFQFDYEIMDARIDSRELNDQEQTDQAKSVYSKESFKTYYQALLHALTTTLKLI